VIKAIGKIGWCVKLEVAWELVWVLSWVVHWLEMRRKRCRILNKKGWEMGQSYLRGLMQKS